MTSFCSSRALDYIKILIMGTMQRWSCKKSLFNDNVTQTQGAVSRSGGKDKSYLKKKGVTRGPLVGHKNLLVITTLVEQRQAARGIKCGFSPSGDSADPLPPTQTSPAMIRPVSATPTTLPSTPYAVSHVNTHTHTHTHRTVWAPLEPCVIQLGKCTHTR